MKVLLVFLSVAWTARALDCTVADGAKTDCGFVGINQTGCQAKGCCWATSSHSGIPWCFHSKGSGPSPSPSPPPPSGKSCFVLSNATSSTENPPFSDAERTTMLGLLRKNINIQGKGGIVAAPDANTPGGTYIFHWERDGALTMRALQEITAADQWASIEADVESYAKWVTARQAESDPHGQDVRTEPKYMLPDGAVFPGAWCRPQNDGPGLRAVALMMAAERLEPSFVSQYLWTGDSAKLNGGAIKFDLDYLSSGGWSSNTCDLWEEVQSADFFWNRVTMKKAMLVGARFAAKMGDHDSAARYRATAQAVNSTLLADHFQGDGSGDSFLYETSFRQKDGAVIVGLNDGYDADDASDAASFLRPTSLQVAATVASFNAAFCAEFPINAHDSANAVPGVLYGRYPGDHYAGGNPWVLTTAALAQLLYRAAQASLVPGGALTGAALTKWAEALNAPNLLETKAEDTAAIAAVFAAAGDSVMLRLHSHVVADGGHLDEQIDKNSGRQMSAKDLTWSYAETLNAMHHRDLYHQKAAGNDAA